MNLYIDIETIPAQDPAVRAELLAKVKPPGTYKKSESIAEWMRENAEAEADAALLQTSFDGAVGQIVAIGWAWDDEDPHVQTVENLSADEEFALLYIVFAQWSNRRSGNHGTRPVIVGHNHVGFDIPYIWKRAMVNNVKPPIWFPRNPKPWSESVVDTMHLWDSTQRAGGSMDRICRVLGIPGKEGMSGADVWPAIQAGRFAEVGAYCAGDVERTRAMYKRMMFE